AADGQIEEQVERPVEAPVRGVARVLPVGEVLRSVAIEIQLVVLPFDGVDVEVVERRGDIDVPAPLYFAWIVDRARRVDGRVDRVGLVADVLHDVDLAALRPADG